MTEIEILYNNTLKDTQGNKVITYPIYNLMMIF